MFIILTNISIEKGIHVSNEDIIMKNIFIKLLIKIY
jgi:hypothetical protein